MTTEAPKAGAFTSRYGTDAKRAMHHIECIKHIGKCTESFPVDEVWKFFDDLTIEKREELIKRAVKTEKKRAAKFTTDTIAKPKNIINSYREEYREECKASGKEFKETEFKEAYHALSDDDKARLQAAHEADKKRYEAEFEAAKQQAILSGDYTEPKPKAPQTSYFLFSNMIQEDIKLKKSKYLNAEQRKVFEEIMKTKPYTGPVAKQIKALYDELSDNDRKLWADKADEARAKYNQDVFEWKVRVLQRQIAKCERESSDPTPYRKELEEVMTAGPAKLKPKVVVATTDPAAAAPKTTNAKASKPTVKVVAKAAPAEDTAATSTHEASESEAEPAAVATAPATKKSGGKGGKKAAAPAEPAVASESETETAEPAAPPAKKGRASTKKTAPPPEPVVEEDEAEETA
jgi:hypothetical protein